MGEDRQKILITGASGFVGRELVGELVRRGKFEIYGLVGKRPRAEMLEEIGGAKFVSLDIADYGTFSEAKREFRDVAQVIHTAGLAHQFGRVTREDFWKVNVKGTDNACRLALEIGAQHFVLISSVAVYGDHASAEIDETCECHPEGFYAESKLEAERRAAEFCRANGLRLTILRPSTIIGEGDRGNTSRLVRLIDRRMFVWIGSGENKKSLIYKRDVARGILRTIESQAADDLEIYNLTARAVSMREIVTAIAENLQTSPPRMNIPESFLRGIFVVNRLPFSIELLSRAEKTLDKWLSDDIFSGEKFNRRFNFAPETEIAVALARQTSYYLKHQKRDT